MKVYFYIFLIMITSSCKSEINQGESHNEKSDSVSLSKNKESKKLTREELFELIESGEITISFTDSDLVYPEDEETLKRWQQLVIEEGDKFEYHYRLLKNYYSENPHLQDEMIKYSEIMIKKNKQNLGYALDFYDYVRDSKSAQKGKLMNRAIKYLKELMEKSDEDPFDNARHILSELYREGIYVKRDTIIADYLYSGGRNLDSIIQNRKIRE